ncbi:hypothetical protein B0T26DRAFT_751115 [Lasiosphaeria miniovina]|uniref:Uncharacterized protein n=1 Tax=Lasiosphaeria miniovina TaxID=1954250 RepID=A0AA40DVD0_9PEZI|nr:uncharacterized protein B0T26DRAFT_751115 [Lasiosphaeria miniovina]KAK0716990.1 hypothetical protein B0T26DRAFT_751115 [Lasiosphaeria miniovina]
MKGLIVLDFDGTITCRDTIAALAHRAIANQDDDGGGDERRRKRESWRAVVDAYLADYRRHVASWKYSSPASGASGGGDNGLAGSGDDDGDNGGGALALERELAFLESLCIVERASLARVAAAGLFRRLRRADLLRFGAKAVAAAAGGGAGDVKLKGDGDGGDDAVYLRAGFREFVHEVGGAVGGRRGDGRNGDGDGDGNGWRLGLVSVNWSGAFVEGVLGETPARFAAGMRVNEVSWPDGRITGPSPLSPAEHGESPPPPLLTAGDKLAAFQSLKRASAAEEDEERSREVVVYVGDSVTDLACLLDADVGVVMVDGDGDKADSKLLQTLRRLGLTVPRVVEGGISSPLPRLVWARDFDDILRSKMLDKALVAGRQ